MVYIERLYGDWNDDDIIKSWLDQSTIDCCKLDSHDIKNISTTNISRANISTANISTANKYNIKLINTDYKINTNKKLNTKINIINVNNNGEYSRRNENFNEKFKIRYKRNNQNR
jgi:hypothetical protein